MYETIMPSQQIPLFVQRLSSSRAVGIEVRSFAKTDRPLPCPRAKPVIIICRSMVNASIVPYCEIVGVLPSEPHLEIVVLGDQFNKPLEQV
jgi:hypothetical protein